MIFQPEIKKKRLSSQSHSQTPSLKKMSQINEIMSIVERRLVEFKKGLKEEIKEYFKHREERQDTERKYVLGKSQVKRKENKNRPYLSKTITSNKFGKLQMYTNMRTTKGRSTKPDELKSTKKKKGKRNRNLVTSLSFFRPKKENKWLNPRRVDKPPFRDSVNELYSSIKEGMNYPGNDKVNKANYPICQSMKNNTMSFARNSTQANQVIGTPQPSSRHITVQPKYNKKHDTIADSGNLNNSFDDFLSVKKESLKESQKESSRAIPMEAFNFHHTGKICQYEDFQTYNTSRKKTSDSFVEPMSLRNLHNNSPPEQIINGFHNNSPPEQMAKLESIKEDSVSSDGDEHDIFKTRRKKSIKDQYVRRESLLKSSGMLFTFEKKVTEPVQLSGTKEIHDFAP